MIETATIILKLQEDKYKTICVKTGGDLKWTGKILYTYYNNLYKINELLKLGNLVHVSRYIDKEPYMTKEDAILNCLYVEAYSRDLGQPYEMNQPIIYKSLVEVFTRRKTEYYYLYNDNHWEVTIKGSWKSWKNLKEKLQKDGTTETYI